MRNTTMGGRGSRVAWRAGFAAGAVAVAMTAAGCSIGVKRDLSHMKPQEVIFDDTCGLQPYFDALEQGKLQAPSVVSAREIQKEPGKPLGGQSVYAFETDFQKKELRRVLGENWKKVPDAVMKAETVNVDVRWAQKAGVARLVTEEDATISVGADSWSLAYHQCLSELLFGAPLYKTRRAMLEPPPAPPVAMTPPLPDAPAAAIPVSTATAAAPLPLPPRETEAPAAPAAETPAPAPTP